MGRLAVSTVAKMCILSRKFEGGDEHKYTIPLLLAHTVANIENIRFLLVDHSNIYYTI